MVETNYTTSDIATDVSTIARQTGRISLGKILIAGLMAIVIALAANFAISTIGRRIFGVSPDFAPLGPGPQTLFTVTGSLGATLVFAAIVHFASSPLETFRRIAGIALGVSFIPDLLLLLSGSAGAVPGYSVVAIGLLLVEHMLTCIICVGLLIRLTRAPAR